jgi:hypothetical protein
MNAAATFFRRAVDYAILVERRSRDVRGGMRLL